MPVNSMTKSHYATATFSPGEADMAVAGAGENECWELLAAVLYHINPFLGGKSHYKYIYIYTYVYVYIYMYIYIYHVMYRHIVYIYI